MVILLVKYQFVNMLLPGVHLQFMRYFVTLRKQNNPTCVNRALIIFAFTSKSVNSQADVAYIHINAELDNHLNL